MATPRILFVDDDEDVLRGLGRALRKHRTRWDMAFVLGGPAAVAEVRRATFDVVVTDMRMPEVDGATVLLEARDRDPTTIRLILSGFSDQESTAKVLSVAHQFLEKPCELHVLSDAIDRATRLRAAFVGAPVRAFIDRLAHLASPMAPSPAGGPARSAQIVRLAASAFLGVEQPAASPADPASPAGLEYQAATALAALAERVIREPIAGFSFEALRQHSQTIAERAQRGVSDLTLGADAFTAGLVHDVGKLLIAVAMPDEHAAISHRLEQPGTKRAAVEREVLGTTHAELSACVLTLCGLPLAVVEAVAFHGSEVVPPTQVALALHAAHAA